MMCQMRCAKNWLTSFPSRGSKCGTSSGEKNLRSHRTHVGAGIMANPYGGWRLSREVSRDIRAADWARVYDWISRLWPEFEQAGLQVLFREGVNKILAANVVV